MPRAENLRLAAPETSRRPSPVVAGAFFLLVAAGWTPSAVFGAPLCAAGAGDGWCIARRFLGDHPQGQLGFRFGEPLDVDGDGVADLAAGSRSAKDGTHEAGTAGVWSGATGAAIRTWKGPPEDSLFGHWVMAVPDLNGDGRADVVIAAPNANVGGVMTGMLTARSPATGAELWRRSGRQGPSQFAWDLALASDHSGDGLVDLFVGEPSENGGRTHLLNGKDGTRIRTYTPPVRTSSFGWYVARIDDLDGDAVPDLAVGAPPGYGADDPPNGAAYVFSAARGTMIRRWEGTQPGFGFGEQVAALGDLDGDGHGEVVVATPPGSTDQARRLAGEVHVYSGTTGNELRRWHGTQPGELYGRMVVAAGDVDGDGVDDLAIGAPWHRTELGDRVGRVELRSGRSGAVLGGIVGDLADAWFGWHIRRAPDPEGRGRPALLVGAHRRTVGGEWSVGAVDLLVLRPKGDTRADSETSHRASPAESPTSPQGTSKRGGRRSAIK